jgi:hypothetical protein
MVYGGINMNKKFTTYWKTIKRALLADGFTYTNHGGVGEFNKGDVLLLINKEDPWDLSYVAYLGENPISFHIMLNHSIFFIGGLQGSVKQIPAEKAPEFFSQTVYVYLGGSSHKGHGIPRNLAKKEMGIE